jgi:Ca2+-binding RTX toxin-like protein
MSLRIRFFLGTGVDADDGLLQNSRANADDVDAALPDDEDGVLNPLDLLGTEGAAPTITLLATNTTGSTATLSGWIDYNRDGVFDNASERAQITVPDGSTDMRFTLTFPPIPIGLAGSTYTRFRLSTDVAGQNATGAASDGEVEDYAFSITAQTTGTVNRFLKIAHELNGGPTLANVDTFGFSVAGIGDLDGDGVADLAVGAFRDDTGGSNRGTVYVLFMNADGTVKTSTKIASDTGGGPTLANNDGFGYSVAGIGDLDGNGVADLAVGARGDDTGGSSRGAVYLLLLNTDGTVKSSTKIANDTGGGPTLANGDVFGFSVAGIGDLDGDGVADLAVGAFRDDTGGRDRGAVHVLLLNSDGTVKSSTRIASGMNGGPVLENYGNFGSAVAGVGDLNGDGVGDLAVGVYHDRTGGSLRGAVHVLLLNADGTVKSSTKIASDTGGGPTLANADVFGRSVAGVGDLDGDGVADLAVGAHLDDTGGSARGAVHVLLLNADGTVKNSTKIASGTNGGPTLTDNDFFGSSVAGVGNLDGDGVAGLAVGARYDATGGNLRGAIYVLFLNLSPDVVLRLPEGGGDYEVLRDGADLVVRVAGGNELARRTAATLASLTLNGSSESDVVTVLDSGIPVDTPIIFNGGDGNDSFDGSLAMAALAVDGGLGNDFLIGSSFDDTLSGGDGDDTLFSGGGRDSVLGGNGNDLVHGGGGHDTLSGGPGIDIIQGRSTNTLFEQLPDGVNNFILGEDAIPANIREVIIEGNDLSNVTAANGHCNFTLPIRRINGGRDTLIGTQRSDLLEGGDGDDRLLGLSGDDTQLGEAGDDVLLGRDGRDVLFGGDGNDRLFGSQGPNTFSGGPGDDFITGAGGSILIEHAIGTQPLIVGADGVVGRDTINTFVRGILLQGDDEANQIDASLYSGRAPVTIVGGGGDDILIGAKNATRLEGGDGDDVLVGQQRGDLLLGQAGNDVLNGGGGNDVLFGGDGNDNLRGHSGRDVILGESGNDTLFGVNGNDVLLGGDGDDLLHGGNGNDDLLGELGEDELDGGAGTDRFNSGEGTDVVRLGVRVRSKRDSRGAQLMTDF